MDTIAQFFLVYTENRSLAYQKVVYYSSTSVIQNIPSNHLKILEMSLRQPPEDFGNVS